MDLFEALNDIQCNISVAKTREVLNSNGALMYQYRNLDDILNALKPFLKKHKLLLYFTDRCINSEGQCVYELREVTKWSKTVLKPLMVEHPFTLIETIVTIRKGDDIISSSFIGYPEFIGDKSAGQMAGETSSYNRKYALQGLLLLDDGKDIDSNVAEVETYGSDFINKTEKQNLFNKLKQSGITDQVEQREFILKHGHKSSATITKIDYNKMLGEL